MLLNSNYLKNAERLLRLFLISLLIMTAFYKLIVGGDNLIQYYTPKFAANPYGLSMETFSIFLVAIGPIELLIALALTFSQTRNLGLHSYFLLLTILMFGHFCLSEFHEVNGLFDYFFAGLLIYILPQHRSLWHRSKT